MEEVMSSMTDMKNNKTIRTQIQGKYHDNMNLLFPKKSNQFFEPEK